MGVSLTLHNLGSVAERRGDLAAAEQRYSRALSFWSQHQPESVGMASGMVSLASVALKSGRLEVAGQVAPRAWELAGARDAGGIVSGEAALCIGDIGVAAGDLDAAEAWYAMALKIRQAQQPGSGAEAEAYQRLGALKRRRKRTDEALPLYLRALDILDRQTRTLGGTDEIRSRFAALYAPYYHETIDLLMQLGRPEEAFHVVERYRARAFLALLTERDLVFTADVPEALDRERRALRAGARPRVRGPRGGPPARRGRRRARRSTPCDGARARSTRGSGPPRPVWPRCSSRSLSICPRRARPWTRGRCSSRTRSADSRGYLFAVGPGRDDFMAVRIDVTLAKLRADVGRFRRLLQAVSPLGTDPLRAMAAELGATLLGPVADRIARAERLLILPDGPLHLIPFAALADPSSPAGGRYLVEARPVHTAASATVFAEIAKARRPKRPARLFALGDPDYGSTGAAAASRAGALRERGLELSPLPGSRREVPGHRAALPGGVARPRGGRRPARTRFAGSGGNRRFSISRATPWRTRPRPWTRPWCWLCPRSGSRARPTACCRPGRSSSRCGSTPTSWPCRPAVLPWARRCRARACSASPARSSTRARAACWPRSGP
jgi:hypothetical protein